MKEKNKYLTLFLSTMTLSAFTFGGGYVIVSLMKRKFVDELHWLEEDEMLDMTAIAQSCPGAVAVNAAILVGHRVAGFLGTLVSIIGTIILLLRRLSQQPDRGSGAEGHGVRHRRGDCRRDRKSGRQCLAGVGSRGGGHHGAGLLCLLVL